VVVPLLFREIAAGHLVILHAMLCGRPVIASKTLRTLQYIEDGANGI
jgi:glycosyltransferase involved in cell wall biosynthesis